MNTRTILYLLLSLSLLSACSSTSTRKQSAPILNNAEAILEQTNQGKNYQISAFYSDADGDAINLDLEIIRTTREGLEINDTPLTKGDSQKTETEQSAGTWRCGLSQNYDLDISVTIVDEQDLKSETKVLEIDCSL